MNETKIENEPKKPTGLQQEQFKSTKKWNEIIDSFCGGMPLKRHWRNFRTYTDCFTASEAIDWVYKYLKASANFQHLNITRQNAIKLLQIFLKERIIEDVRSGENFVFKEFQDDDRIYRFCTNNPNYLNRNSNISTSNTTGQASNIIESQVNESVDIKKHSNVLNEKQLNNQQGDLNNLLNQEKPKKQIVNSKENNNLIVESRRLSSGNVKLKLNEYEIWSKVSRKLFESIIRKAVLNSNIGKLKNSTSDCQVNLNLGLVSPKSSSTLKRSQDIKFGLTKILDKKSNDILLNLSGKNIEHNCNNVNKHGVVINTNEDLPDWVVNAMTTLLSWESENDDQLPSFLDLYQEIVDYYTFHNEPLLTNDLSYLFIQILNVLLVKGEQKKATNKIDEIINYPDSIDELINNLKNQLNNLSNKNTNECSTHKLLDYLANASSEVNEVEAKLLENAKLPLMNLEQDTEPELEYSNGEQKEVLLQNLILASIAQMETCCSKCLNTYNDINELINKKPGELDEVLLYLNNEETCDLEENQYLNGKLDQFEFNNEYEDEDLIDIDDYDEFTSSGSLIQKFNPKDLDSILNSTSITTKPVNKLLTKSLSDKRLHRNNSFRAAIGNLAQRPKTIVEGEATPKKSMIIRSSTNNSSDFNFTRTNLNKTEILFDPSSNDIDFISYPAKLRQLSVKDDFNFKLPNPIENCSKSTNITKSVSMSFKSDLDAPNLRRQKWANNNKMCSLSNIDESRKRKASFTSSSTESISSCSSSFRCSTQKQPTKLNRNESISQFKTTKILPSMSLTSLDNLNTSLSMRNLNQTKQLSNLSLNELSTCIKTSLSKNQISKQEKNKLHLSLSTPIDSDLFSHIIHAFRLLALMLPPGNKRKLHFLLRFLNKLKYNKHSAKYLLRNKITPLDNEESDSYLNQLKDLNYIDSSLLSHNTENLCEKQKRKSLSKDLELKSNAIESVIIKSFLKSIVKLESDLLISEQIGAKIVQILINNYSEVMRIPEDLISSVRQKISLNNQKEKSGFCGKISLQEYEKQKQDTNGYLTNLWDNIVKDPNMSHEEKMKSLRKLQEAHPHIFQEANKKLFNFLGLNDSISYASLSQNDFLRKRTDSAKKSISNNNNNSSSSSSSCSGSSLTVKMSSSGNSSCLNQTTMSAYSSRNSMFQASTSINFPKFFLNKKWKKENLI